MAKEVKLVALQKGIRIHQYLEDWLVQARSHQICLQHPQTLVTVLGPRLASKFGKIRTGTQAGFRPCRLPVRPERGQGQTHPRPVADTKDQNQRIINRTDLSGPTTDVPHRTINSNRKAGPPRQTPYEAHTMAPQTKLEGPFQKSIKQYILKIAYLCKKLLVPVC